MILLVASYYGNALTPYTRKSTYQIIKPDGSSTLIKREFGNYSLRVSKDLATWYINFHNNEIKYFNTNFIKSKITETGNMDIFQATDQNGEKVKIVFNVNQETQKQTVLIMYPTFFISYDQEH